MAAAGGRCWCPESITRSRPWGQWINDVWALGGLYSGGRSDFLHYDCESWQQVAGPTTNSGYEFTTLASTSPTDLWALGVYRPTGGVSDLVTAHWAAQSGV